MGSVVLNCRTISELPRPEDLATESRMAYVNLPVVCLALLRLPEWRFGFMLVTDFTDNFQSQYATGAVSQMLPRDLSFGNVANLPSSKVFPVTVAGNKLDMYWERLCTYSPSLKSYNPYDPMSCDFSKEGVVCTINMRVKEYSSRIEGWLANLQTCTRSELKKPVFKKFLQANNFGSFVTRLLQHVDEPLYDKLLPNFPIDSYMNRSDLAKKKEPAPVAQKRPDEGFITQAPKTRKISAAQVTFQQQFTQPAESQIEDDEPSSQSQITTPSQQRDVQISASDESLPSIGKWLKFDVNRIPFSEFVSLSFEDVPEAATFETTCVLFKTIPNTNQLFIRPFKRTMKAADFKLVLKGVGDQMAFAEFHQESDINRFFEVDEVEEIIPVMEETLRRLRSLVGSQIRLRLQKRLLDLDFGFQKPYWVCRSSLKELSNIFD